MSPPNWAILVGICYNIKMMRLRMKQTCDVRQRAAVPCGEYARRLLAPALGAVVAVALACAAAPAAAQASDLDDALWSGNATTTVEQAMSTAPVLAEGLAADMVLVYKARRTMYLMREGKVMRSYQVALGRNPLGHKNQEGDGRTPEGGYLIDWRNPNSDFHLSLHISYPRPQDYSIASEAGADPGGAIMIHGLPNGRSADQVGHPGFDWTNGCIAVSNEEIEEIWQLVDDGTAIFILP